MLSESLAARDRWNDPYMSAEEFDKERAAACENLGMLIRNRVVSYPHYPELIAELDVFKSDFTFSGAPDYSMQTAQQSGIHALCLVTYDVDPQALSPPFENVFYHHYPDLIHD